MKTSDQNMDQNTTDLCHTDSEISDYESDDNNDDQSGSIEANDINMDTNTSQKTSKEVAICSGEESMDESNRSDPQSSGQQTGIQFKINRKPKGKRIRRTIRVEDKIRILNQMKVNNWSQTKTSKIEGITRSTLKQWMDQEDNLRSMLAKRDVSVRERSYVQKNRKPKLPEVDNAVLDKLKDMRSKGLIVTGEVLKTQALDTS